MDYLEEYCNFCFDCNYKNVIDHCICNKAIIKRINAHIVSDCDKLELHHLLPKACGGKNSFCYNMLVLTSTEHKIAHDILSKAIIQRRLDNAINWRSLISIHVHKNLKKICCSQTFSRKYGIRKYLHIAMAKNDIRRITQQ